VRFKASISSPRGIVPQKLSAAQYCFLGVTFLHVLDGLGCNGDGADAGGHHVQLSSGQDGQATRQQGTFKYINLSLRFSVKTA
jgi:hypothetical protein